MYSETQQYCAPFFLSGLAVSGPGTMLVEMGTLLGHSSRCMAQGLAAREQAKRNMSSCSLRYSRGSLRSGLEHKRLRTRLPRCAGNLMSPEPLLRLVIVVQLIVYRSYRVS